MGIRKSLKMLALGYVWFRVNDRKFIIYGNARRHQRTIKGNSVFYGWNLFHAVRDWLTHLPYAGWRCFYVRWESSLRKDSIDEAGAEGDWVIASAEE